MQQFEILLNLRHTLTFVTFLEQLRVEVLGNGLLQKRIII